MDKVDITIIGAGVIGLAIGAELSGKGQQVILLEKNLSFGQETSSRNSEVIHAGLYYNTGSLKARMCVKGNRLLYALCQKTGIKYLNTGKLIIARNPEETAILEKIKKQGEDNGVEGLKLLSRKKLRQLEPEVKGIAALLSPLTGIINSHELMEYYVNTIEKNSGILVYDSEVTTISPIDKGYLLEIKKHNYQFFSKIIINAAGLFSDQIAANAGINIDQAGYRLSFCKGEYFSLSKKIDVKHLIYGVPTTDGLGIHLVISLDGGLRFGPNDFYVKEIDYQVDPKHQSQFLDSCNDYFEGIDEQDLVPDMSGIRPRLSQSREDGFRDFIIKEESEKGLPGMVNLIGIESPGLTAAPAIAEYVANITNKLHLIDS